MYRYYVSQAVLTRKIQHALPVEGLAPLAAA